MTKVFTGDIQLYHGSDILVKEPNTMGGRAIADDINIFIKTKLNFNNKSEKITLKKP
jgi:hypothetical protein